MNIIKRAGQKVTIEGVRKISWETGEMCEFASALAAALESMGDPISYPFLMGTSGVAFRFTLNPGQWDFGNYSIRNIAANVYAPIDHAFAAAGYAYSLHEPVSFQEDAALIMDSIDQGVPVLAFHVVGPSDCCIISGYDDRGKVLLGWSTYQDIPDDHNIPHDETGYFRKPGWHENIPGFILIGARQERQPPRAVYLDALKWAVHLMRTSRMDHKATGLEGLRVWSEEMTQAKYFLPGDDDTAGQRYVSAAINLTMLRDHVTAEAFLRQAIAEVPEFQPELSRAAGCYGEVRRLLDEMNGLISDNFAEWAMKAIQDAEIRRKYAEKILEIRAVEDEAAREMEQLLTRCG